MAHELTHVKHRDTLISKISAIAAGAIFAIAHFGLFFGRRNEDGNAVNPLVALLIMIVAPFAAMLIQLAIARASSRPTGAEPKSAATPRRSLPRSTRCSASLPGSRCPPAQAHPETAQMMIVNPLAGSGLAGLFSTHPETGERVARLREMAVGFATS